MKNRRERLRLRFGARSAYLIGTGFQVSRIVSSMKMTILLHLDLIFQNFRITLSSHLFICT